MIDLRLGDCLEILRTLGDSSIDSVVTDPPYGLSFMGKKWDYDVPSPELWEEVLRVLKPGGHLLTFGGARTYHRLAVNVEDGGFEIRDQIVWIYATGFPKSKNQLKPAMEPIVLARRRPIKSVVANVLKYGTGDINIDESRVGNSGGCKYDAKGKGHEPSINALAGGHLRAGGRVYADGLNIDRCPRVEGLGRWPANVLHDGSPEATDGMGKASRYFYGSKASKKDRGEGNTHPTVKPTDLMRYLVRLITPKGGVVLDPFMGSGTTGVAAKSEGFSFLGIEREPDYLEIAKGRIHASD